MAVDLGIAAVRRARPWSARQEALVVAAVGLAIPTGTLIGSGWGIQLVMLAGLLAGFLLGLADWRRSVYGLLAYLPFSGVANVLLYPRVAPALLVKDLLFVIPAYVGFLVQQVNARRPMSYRGAPLWLIASFVVLVVGQIFNPNLPNRLVGAIGAKVWLFYIPMCFLGYHLIRDRRDLHRLLGVMSAVAAVPALIGIGEAVLLYAGQETLVYGAYGEAAAATTQNFVQFDFAGGGTLRRIPSTFSYVAQYFSFTVSMVAVTYAWWRGAFGRSRAAGLGLALWLTMLLAAFLCGARGAFLSIPLLVLLIVFLERRGRIVAIRLAIAPAALLICSAVILRANPAAVILHTIEVATSEFGDVFLDGIRSAASLTLMGLGAGINTIGARYAYPQAAQFSAVASTWHESWYAKALVELGLPGLALLLATLAIITIRAFRRHRRLHDAQLRAVSASLLALVVWNVVYGLKGGLIDIDPMNVYFWFFVGVLAKITALDEQAPAPDDGSRG